MNSIDPKGFTPHLPETTVALNRIPATSSQTQPAWISAAILFCVPLLSTYLLLPTIEQYFPTVSFEFFSSATILATEILVLSYLMSRLGSIKLQEFLPMGREYFILIFGITSIFCFYSVIAGPEGINSRSYNAIRDLPTWQYWARISGMVLISPLLEESYFRRYFFEILRNRFPLKIAVLLTTTVGTIFHLGTGLFGTFCWQFLLTIIYVKSRLGVSFALHAFINAMIIIFAK